MTGDQGRVRQILSHLVSNAVKFTALGQVTVSVSARPNGVRLRVRDTGVGFDAQAGNVFRRFEQADATITRRFGGSGLGLAISRELAELMGGSLDCSSIVGVGSDFWADLPLVVATVQETVAANSAEPEVFRQLSILAADDHPTNLKVVQLILAQIGAEITAVENGAEAVTAFKVKPYDLVLMDMQMPVLDGLSAVRQIRTWEADRNETRTPVLMLTANAMAEHRAASAAAGADGHVAKPITSEALIRAIACALEYTDAPGEGGSERIAVS